MRVRQATLQNHKNYESVFGLKSHTNIMSLPYPCKIAEEMNLQEEKHSKKFDFDQLTKESGPLAHPVILSTTKSDLPLTSFRDIIYDAKKTPESKFRARFSVQSVYPDPSSNELSALRFFNPKTGASRPIASKSDKAKPGEKLVLFVQLACKDASVMFSGDFLRMTVVQESDKGFFTGISPADILGSTKKHQDAQVRL